MSRDRFTEKDENGKWAVRLSEDCQMTIESSEKVNNDGSKTCTPVFVYAPFVDRLAEFEESGFHTEDLQKIRKEILYSQAFGITMSRERFDEICEAERNGRLLALPCKVGDTAFATNVSFSFAPYIRCVVIGFQISTFEKEEKLFVELEEIDPPCASLFVSADDFGKTVFLNEAEAKTALKLVQMGGET